MDPTDDTYERMSKELEEARRALGEAERHYRLIAENTQDFIWTVDLGTGRYTYVSPAVTALRGLTPEEALREPFERSFNPDSCHRIKERVRRALERLSEGGGESVPVCREVFAQPFRDGNEKLVETVLTLVSGPGGVRELLGVSRDVGARIEAENLLRENEERFRGMVEMVPFPLILTTMRDHMITYINRRACETLGVEPRSVIGMQTVSFYANPEDRASVIKELEEKGAVLEREALMKTSSGETFWALLSARLIPYWGDQMVLLVMNDITERKALEGELRRLANTDMLTGIANRRSFMESLRREIMRARRYGRPLSLLMLDVDHFKRINDTHGHPCGDEVLKKLAVTVRETLRDSDLFGRIGGEEFAVALPETPLAGALQNAERVRAEVGRAVVSFGGREIRFAVSIGAAALADGGEDMEGLFSRVDAALYRAKEGGRNRVCAG